MHHNNGRDLREWTSEDTYKDMINRKKVITKKRVKQIIVP